MNKLLVPIFCFCLVGCSEKVTVPVVNSFTDASGKIINNVATHTGTASTYKEYVVVDGLKHQATEVRLAHENSGIRVEFEVVKKTYFFPGMKEPITIPENEVKMVEYRPQAEFRQKLPTKPSVHPVWDTTKTIAVKGLDVFLWAFGIDRISGVWESTANQKTYDFTGSDSEIYGSFGTLGGSQELDLTQYRGAYSPTEMVLLPEN
jgi:hypothetical protein